MKLFSKLIASISLFIGLSVFAQQSQTIGVALTPATNSVLGAKASIASFTLLSTAAGSVAFYDSATNTITYTNAIYTNYSSFTTNITQLYTNTQGIIQTNILVGTWRYPVVVAASTNNRPIIQTVFFSAGIPVTMDVNWLVVNGLAAVASTNATLSVTYGALP